MSGQQALATQASGAPVHASMPEPVQPEPTAPGEPELTAQGGQEPTATADDVTLDQLDAATQNASSPSGKGKSRKGKFKY